MNEKKACLTLVLHDDITLISWAAFIVRGFCELVNCPIEDTNRLELALVEALNNIFLHGAAGQSDLEVSVSIRCEGNCLIMELTDNGTAIPDATVNTMPDPLSESSRGLPLIHVCMDEVAYSRDGNMNVLLLKKTLSLPK